MSPAPCFEDDLLDGVGQGEFADVVEMPLCPVGLAGVAHAVAQHEGEQLLLGAGSRLDGIGAGAAEVAHGLIPPGSAIRLRGGGGASAQWQCRWARGC